MWESTCLNKKLQQAHGLNYRGYRGNLGREKGKFNAYLWLLNGIAHTPRGPRLTTWPSATNRDRKSWINQVAVSFLHGFSLDSLARQWQQFVALRCPEATTWMRTSFVCFLPALDSIKKRHVVTVW